MDESMYYLFPGQNHNESLKFRKFTSNNKMSGSMSQLNEGQTAPAFEGIDQDDNKIELRDFYGGKVILFFYPKDDTPACTAEACNLRDNYKGLQGKGFIVIGISADNKKSHTGFVKKYSLPFPLIADPEKKIINSYGVWGEKMLFGKKIMGILRTTFIIDEKGIIKKIISKVDTANHTEQILKLLTNKTI
jgi:thioredoxin-dependent peroxiredoxin